MADETVSLELNVNPGKSVKTVGEIRKEIKDLNTEIQSVEVGSKKYAELSTKLAKARDAVRDLREESRLLNPEDQAKAFINLGQTIVGGFAAAQGAMALFSKDNKELQEAFMKAQAAVAVLQGVQAIADAKRSVELVKYIAMQRVSNLQTTLAGAAESKNIVIRYAAAAAQKVLNAVMAANPVGLLITAIAALAAGVAYFATKEDEATESTEQFNARMDAQIEKSKQLKDVYQKQIDIRLNLLKDGQHKEIAIITERYRREEEAFKNNAKALKVLEENKQLEIQAVKDKYAEKDRIKREEEEKKRQAIQASVAEREKFNADARVSLQGLMEETLSQEESEGIDERNMLAVDEGNDLVKLHEDRLARIKAIEESRLQIAQSTAMGLVALGEILNANTKRAANFQKAATLIQLGADTASAIGSLTKASLKTEATLPPPAGTIAAIAQYSAGISRILVNIAAAKRALSGGGSISAGGGGGTPSFGGGGGGTFGQTPQGVGVPLLATAQTQPTTQIGAGGVPVVKAFVTETDITRAQQRISTIKEKSKTD